MKSNLEIPEHLRALRDEAIDHLLRGGPNPNLKPLYDWFEFDGWDVILDSWAHEDLAFNLLYLAQFKFEDSEMASCEGLEVEDITDELRITYARTCIQSERDDEYLTPSLHSIELRRSEDESVILGCLMEIHGQSGPYLNWWGLFKTQADFYESIINSGYIIESDLDGITDEKILSMWKNSQTYEH